jgi:hypothetical protein
MIEFMLHLRSSWVLLSPSDFSLISDWVLSCFISWAR